MDARSPDISTISTTCYLGLKTVARAARNGCHVCSGNPRTWCAGEEEVELKAVQGVFAHGLGYLDDGLPLTQLGQDLETGHM